ncbi:MAG: CPC_1213 family protein [Clostridium sp.]
MKKSKTHTHKHINHDPRVESAKAVFNDGTAKQSKATDK